MLENPEINFEPFPFTEDYYEHYKKQGDELKKIHNEERQAEDVFSRKSAHNDLRYEFQKLFKRFIFFRILWMIFLFLNIVLMVLMSSIE